MSPARQSCPARITTKWLSGKNRAAAAQRRFAALPGLFDPGEAISEVIDTAHSAVAAELLQDLRRSLLEPPQNSDRER
jgi:hypothetical protein